MAEPLSERQSMIKALRDTNAEILARIDKLGGEPTNVDAARHEQFVAFLMNEGVITPDQAETWTLLWQDHFNGILMELEVQLMKIRREQQAEYEKQRRAARAPRLIVPGSPPPGI